MPTYLTQEDVYRVLQRELPPDDVYPDGDPSGFFSTADQFSLAKVVADAYANQQSIYTNYFPTEAVERLSDHEIAFFGYSLDQTLTIDERRARLLSKIRTRRRTTQADILAEVYTILDPSILVEIVPWGCGCAGWVLDVSLLDISTILNEFNGLERTGPDLCSLDAADFGLTEEEFLRLRAEAYTYEVRIYGYTLTAEQRQAIDTALNAAEPVRSFHIIVDGLDPADAIGGDL